MILNTVDKTKIKNKVLKSYNAQFTLSNENNILLKNISYLKCRNLTDCFQFDSTIEIATF